MKMLLIGALLWLVSGCGMAEPTVIGPQSDPQETFLTCSADIAIMGGGAGGGKTFALLLDPLYDVSNAGFRAVLLRRETTQIRGEGGLWDTSRQLYGYCGAVPRESTLRWSFPSGAKVSFAHMEHEEDRYKYDGAQFAFIGFDQVESFTESQFFYMLSRNRSTCGVKPRIRATCNPVPKNHKVGGWLHRLLLAGGWIDGNSGYAIPEMSGKVRWFVNINNEIRWADSPDELKQIYGDDCSPLSFTFILAKLSDNKILQIKDPGYRARLMGGRQVERERLLGADESKGGNWNVHEHAGSFFQRGYFQIIPQPPRCAKIIRYWDRAATSADEAKKKSSFTAGVKLGRTDDSEYVILHVERFQGSPGHVQKSIDSIATSDGRDVKIGIEQDPGQAGKVEAEMHKKRLIGLGFTAYVNPVHESKGKRAEPVSIAAESRLIKIVDGTWVEELLNELENYDGTDGCMADQVDALSGAFLGLTKKKEGYIG